MATKTNRRKPTKNQRKPRAKKTEGFVMPKLRMPTNINFDFGFVSHPKFRLAVGIISIALTLSLTLAMVSYLFTGRADFSVIDGLAFNNILESGLEAQNWLGLFGAWVSHLMIWKLFGLPSFLLLPLLFVFGWEMITGRYLFDIKKYGRVAIIGILWGSLLLGTIVNMVKSSTTLGYLCGKFGYNLAIYADGLIGGIGSVLLLVFSAILIVLFYFNEEKLEGLFGQRAEEIDEDDLVYEDDEVEEPAEKEAGDTMTMEVMIPDAEVVTPEEPKAEGNGLSFEVEDTTTQDEEVEITGAMVVADPDAEGNQAEITAANSQDPNVKVEDFDDYDPKLDLPRYEYPKLEILNDVGNTKVKVTETELEENKNTIVKTLNDFKIGIESIRATIGPTVTLYEIVPKAGIKISRIKNLEDDVALSLAALGIRIIAPIPGRGTIGIEVPNKNRQMVTLRSVLATEKFRDSKYMLPIALGRTISNEVFIADLAKMPHLLMAGATGQGKSVGINVVLASLLYKRHPAELKFVLVDPKKVELSLFSKIERHYLAALPDAEETIVTDTRKAVSVLSSLCNEMDIRYDLLKEAGTRNIKEYNDKFMKRRLNPVKGHRYLPYIVLVIDELADLMMTAGKEVEMPIARLAQLARAIGIHLVIATQRPSVDVITGIIKANFPARLSFKVTSKVDSRTILDTSGAEQLIGMGDMLLSNGSEIIRLQCAFIDTPEVDALCDFVAEQKGYDTPYLLPEADTDEKDNKAVDMSKLDNMFADAARLMVSHQQGSTSLLQRKLSLGYNRAGRIIDQLEAAGIVGSFEGSKAREVLVSDPEHLEDLLSSLNARQ